MCYEDYVSDGGVVEIHNGYVSRGYYTPKKKIFLDDVEIDDPASKNVAIDFFTDKRRKSILSMKGKKPIKVRVAFSYSLEHECEIIYCYTKGRSAK